MTDEPNKEILFGRTPLGQLLYDLAFARLSDRWIARKHKMPIAEVRKCRVAAMLTWLYVKRKKRQ